MSPNEELISLKVRHFQEMNLPDLFVLLNYEINNTKRISFETEFKDKMGSMKRLSWKYIGRKINEEDMGNAHFFFEDKNLDINSRQNFKTPDFIIKVKKGIVDITGEIKHGRPQDYVLKKVITEINNHLKYNCKTELKDHVQDSGNANCSNSRFSGNGITLCQNILASFKVPYHSARSIFDIIKTL